jgi:hypothetical protein
MDRKWLRLDLPQEDRVIAAAYVFAAFAVTNSVLTGQPPAGTRGMDLALFYTGLLIFPVLGSLLAAALLWFVAYAGCFCAGVSGRAPSFTAMLLGASIVVCGALLYGTYCLEGGQYCLAINPKPAIEGLRQGLRPILPPLRTP